MTDMQNTEGAVPKRIGKNIIWRGIALSALASILSGCCLPGLGRGAEISGSPAIYYRGRLEQTLAAPLARVHEASIEALKDITLPIAEDRADKLTAHLTSRYPDGEPVRIDLEALGDTRTRATVRVGLTGDKDRASYVLSRIKKYLTR